MNDDKKPDEETSWDYKPDSGEDGNAEHTVSVKKKPEPEVTWSASEYLAHERGIGWFLLLALASLAAGAILYFFTKSYFSAAIAPILGIIVAIFATHSPAAIEYRLANDGINVGDKFHPYNEFKSFTLIQDDGIPSIVMVPTKRFMPPLSAYLDPKDGQKVIDALGTHLPYDQGKLDFVERLARNLRF